jgi:cystathionine beta-synthase
VGQHGDHKLVMCGSEELVSHAVAKMKAYNISQIPVTKDGVIAGYVDDSALYQSISENAAIRDAPLSQVMQAPLPVLQANATIEEISKNVNKQVPAVLIDMGNGAYHIVTRHDLINAIA